MPLVMPVSHYDLNHHDHAIGEIDLGEFKAKCEQAEGGLPMVLDDFHFMDGEGNSDGKGPALARPLPRCAAKVQFTGLTQNSQVDPAV